ncbi:hypothetical protein IAR50_007594 [Cryptococcus sp. DSM 104548]
MSTSAATKVCTTHDIIANITTMGVLSSRDRFHCLLTSSTFFHATAPVLYHTLPISHACNPLKGASTPPTHSDAGVKMYPSSYGKGKLLVYVKQVYLDYTRFTPGRTKERYWDIDHPCYPLPDVETGIVQILPYQDRFFFQTFPSDITCVRRLCDNAKRLFMGPCQYSYSTFGDPGTFIPYLPRL